MDETGFNHLRGGYGSVYAWGNSQISLLEAATNFLKVFNMSATIARQWGWVQLEQSDMRLALNMAKMAKEGFLRAQMEETEYLIMKPRPEVRDEKERGVESLGHRIVKAVIDRHLAMGRQNHPARFLSCQNGTAKNTQTCWRRKGTGAPPPDWRRQLTPDPSHLCPTRHPPQPVNIPELYIPNQQFATRICVFTYFPCLRWIFYSWWICPG